MALKASKRKEQDMYWRAEYDNKTIKEEDFDFSDIEKEKLKYFLLEGLGIEIIHNVESGDIKIGESNINLYINDYKLGVTNDIINFKEGRSTGFNNNVVGYYTGFKEKNENFKYIEVLFCIDLLSQEMRLRLRVTPEIKEATFGLEVDGNFNEVPLIFEKIGKKTEFNFKL